MKKVVCVGELLIDFICEDIGKGLIEGNAFVKKAGGAPANVCASIAKLGGKASFLGKVGNDSFGYFLKKTLDDVGVETTDLIMDKQESTTLAFVSLQEDGNRDFIFNRGADEKLNLTDINWERFFEADIMHFGSATALLGGELKKSYLELLKKANENGKFISFDPNYRLDLWKERDDEFVKCVRKCLKYTDFVKVSEEELYLIGKKENLFESLKEFFKMGAKTVAVTLGSSGTMISTNSEYELVESIKIKSIDSTGAGDAFVGAVLYKVSETDNLKKLFDDFEKTKEIVNFANKVGAITCTKLGAINALPTIDEIEF